jgi:predicted nucleic acid-binding protein
MAGSVEVLPYLRKVKGKGLLTEEQVKNDFREVLQLFTLKSPTAQIFERAFILHERYSLSHWDSLLVAACQEAGVTRLYSEDMQHGGDYGGVNIVNPLA